MAGEAAVIGHQWPDRSTGRPPPTSRTRRSHGSQRSADGARVGARPVQPANSRVESDSQGRTRSEGRPTRARQPRDRRRTSGGRRGGSGICRKPRSLSLAGTEHDGTVHDPGTAAHRHWQGSVRRRRSREPVLGRFLQRIERFVGHEPDADDRPGSDLQRLAAETPAVGAPDGPPPSDVAASHAADIAVDP
jgi:hypothetical protein